MKLNFKNSLCCIALLTLSACVTTTLNDDILVTTPPVKDVFSKAIAPEVSKYETEIADAKENGSDWTEDLETKAQLVKWFGDEQYHEGRAGIFLGAALDEPLPIGSFDLAIDAGKEHATYMFNKDDYVATSVSRSALTTSYGEVDVLSIEKTEIDTPREARPLIVHCYGNASSLYNNAAVTAKLLLPFGDVVQFEYPGFSSKAENEGSDLGKIENFDPMTDTLAAHFNRQNTSRPLIFWGHSLGGVVCANLAAKVPSSDGLILETSGNDAETIARAVVPSYASLFVKIKVDESLKNFRIDDMLSDFDAPILVMGAKKDRTLKVGLSRDLHAALSATGRDVSYKEFPDANHLSVKQAPELTGTINAFLATP